MKIFKFIVLIFLGIFVLILARIMQMFEFLGLDIAPKWNDWIDETFRAEKWK